MKHFAYFVNYLFLLPRFFALHQMQRFAGRRTIANGYRPCKGYFSYSLFRAVHSPFLADCRNSVAYIGGDHYSCTIRKFVTLASYSRVKVLHVSYA